MLEAGQDQMAFPMIKTEKEGFMRNVLVCCCIAVAVTCENASGSYNSSGVENDQVLTHTWHNSDGSRTERYDGGGQTTFTRTQPPPSLSDQVVAELAYRAIVSSYNAVCKFNDWLKSPECAEAKRQLGRAVNQGLGKAKDCRMKPDFKDKGIQQDRTQATAQSEPVSAEALFKRGRAYYQGQGVPQDYAEAAKLFCHAAILGDTESAYRLGHCYYFGKGVSQDYVTAAEWFRYAAGRGSVSAQCFLGHIFYKGEGVPQDYTEAVKWFRLAAEQRNAEAECNLGVCYHNGNGVPQDYAEALKWFRRAAEQGNEKAKKHIVTCMDKMTPQGDSGVRGTSIRYENH